MSRKVILLIVVLFFLTVFLLLVSLWGIKQETPAPVVSPTPIQILPNSQKEQSKISLIIPGKTNGVGVQKILGTPSEVSNRGSLTELDFPTNQNNFNNTVVLKQNST